eukprot:4259275-Prymnesium_polylepis.1
MATRAWRPLLPPSICLGGAARQPSAPGRADHDAMPRGATAVPFLPRLRDLFSPFKPLSWYCQTSHV